MLLQRAGRPRRRRRAAGAAAHEILLARDPRHLDAPSTLPPVASTVEAGQGRRRAGAGTAVRRARDHARGAREHRRSPRRRHREPRLLVLRHPRPAVPAGQPGRGADLRRRPEPADHPGDPGHPRGPPRRRHLLRGRPVGGVEPRPRAPGDRARQHGAAAHDDAPRPLEVDGRADRGRGRSRRSRSSRRSRVGGRPACVRRTARGTPPSCRCSRRATSRR